MDIQQDIKERAENVLEQIRPYLQEDGGDVEYLRFEEDTKSIVVKMTGQCKTCPMAIMTLRAGIERLLLKEIKEAKRVEAEN